MARSSTRWQERASASSEEEIRALVAEAA